jgi:penicillin-insensitive murein endopeptidase
VTDRLLPLALAFGLVAAAAPEIARADPASSLPARFRQAPYSLMSLSIGHPNAGSQVRAKRLKKSPELVLKQGSEPNSYGHPSLVLMLKRTARQVARGAPGSVMLVGDLSSKDGGRLAGHTSHQSGRDADIGFYVTDSKGKRVLPEKFVAFDAQGRARDGSGLVFDDHRNWLLLQALARDGRAGLSHVFVAAGLRKRLLDWAQARPAFRKYVPAVVGILKQPDNALPHDDHFHVRIACPKSQQQICREESR